MARTSTEAVSRDDAFDILSNARRRYVLYYLREDGGSVALGDLSEELAAWENEVPAADLTKQQRKRVYVSLYQTHIQKLVEAGVVEYDEDSSTVSLAEGATRLGTYLSTDAEDATPVPWQATYVGVAVLSGLLYALVALQVSIASQFSVGQIGLGIVVVFTLLAGVHYLSGRRGSGEIPAEALIRDRG